MTAFATVGCTNRGDLRGSRSMMQLRWGWRPFGRGCRSYDGVIAVQGRKVVGKTAARWCSCDGDANQPWPRLNAAVRGFEPARRKRSRTTTVGDETAAGILFTAVVVLVGAKGDARCVIKVAHYDVGLCQDLLIPVTNFHNEDKGFMVLAGDVFDLPIRKDIIHRVVRWQLAKRQQVVTE
ncbi:Ribosomal protein L4 domain superfamily [Sesbania bispinosa]|nr:Ribosomal protein L4 domain superfamily [Sesbania bispinosa]